MTIYNPNLQAIDLTEYFRRNSPKRYENARKESRLAFFQLFLNRSPQKLDNMKNGIYLRMLIWVVTTGILFTRCASKPEPALASKKQADTAVANKTALEQWESSPDGVRYLTWKASPEGQKVMAASALLQPSIQDSSLLEAVVTSLSLPAGSRLGLGIMVKIQGEDYILSFGPETAAEHQTEAKHAFKQLHTLQVNDRIKIRGGSVTHAPKYAYPIVSGDYVERNGVILYQRPPREDGC